MSSETHSCEAPSPLPDESLIADNLSPSPGDEAHCEAQDNLLFAPEMIDSTPASEQQIQKVDGCGTFETTTPILAQKLPASTKNIFIKVWNEWMIEILACGLAMLALIAIVTTLEIHNGRPLPQWPFGISVNALVSVFAVILKASMMLPVSECALLSPLSRDV